MRRIVTWAAFAMAVAVPAYLAGQQSVGPDYQKIMADFTAAYNKGDAAAIAGFYAEDGLRVAPDGTVHSGRAAVQKNYAAGLAGPNKGASIKLTATESRQLTPDIQVVVGTWEVTGVQGGPVSGKYINTLARRDGKWQIVGNMAMRPAPPPQQPAR
jgi:uncharacterized protein (TIGR02246 family)